MMSRDFYERIAEFVAQLPEDKALLVLRVAGVTVDPDRVATIELMAKAEWSNRKQPPLPEPPVKPLPGVKYRKPIWDLFKIDIEPVDTIAEIDPYAVAVNILRPRSGSWYKTCLGWVPMTEGGNSKIEARFNKFVRILLNKNAVDKVERPPYFDPKSGAEYPKVTTYDVHLLDVGLATNPYLRIGVVADLATVSAIPRGVMVPDIFARSGRIAIGPIGTSDPKKWRFLDEGETSFKDLEYESQGSLPERTLEPEPGPIHQGAIPEEGGLSHPTVEEVQELFEVHEQLRQSFLWSETVDGTLVEEGPVFLSQWSLPLQKFADRGALTTFLAKNRCYGAAETIMDLQQVEDQYGRPMAEAIYSLSGAVAGPFSRRHVQAVIRTIRSILSVLRAAPFGGQS